MEQPPAGIEMPGGKFAATAPVGANATIGETTRRGPFIENGSMARDARERFDVASSRRSRGDQ